MRFAAFRSTSRVLLGALAVATLLVGATPARAADDDLDGVSDDVDLCLDTPPGDLVDADGCSLCPCDLQVSGDDWQSHGEYLACVVQASKQLRRSHAIGRKQAREAVRAARKASCGNPDMTRCCLYPDNADELDTVVGQCRVMSVDDCDALADEHPWVEDADTGSCAPNPCVF